ncbi:hypothetical protein G9A89_016942 [Geosiphon pyriformis]|nr:hypothetical protein G9A89_016942 [Geosiphon pyriformis]
MIAFAAFSEQQDGLFVHSTDSYFDGTLIIRMSQRKNESCLEPKTQFRVVFPNNTLKSWTLDMNIPESNFCNDTINFWALEKDYILLSFLSSTNSGNSTKVNVSAVGISWSGKIFDADKRQIQTNTTGIINLPNIISYNTFPLTVGGFGFFVTTASKSKNSQGTIYDMYLEPEAQKIGPTQYFSNLNLDHVDYYSSSCSDGTQSKSYRCVVAIKKQNDSQPTYNYMERSLPNITKAFDFHQPIEKVQIFDNLYYKDYLVSYNSDEGLVSQISSPDGNSTNLPNVPSDCMMPNLLINKTIWCVNFANSKNWAIFSKDLSTLQRATASNNALDPKKNANQTDANSSGPTDFSTGAWIGIIVASTVVFGIICVAIVMLNIRRNNIEYNGDQSTTIESNFEPQPKWELFDPLSSYNDIIESYATPVHSILFAVHPPWIRAIIEEKLLEYIDIEEFSEKQALGNGDGDMIISALWIPQSMTVILKKLLTINSAFGQNVKLAKEVQENLRVVNHVNIIKLFGVTKHLNSHEYSLVMQYANGGDLSHFLKENFDYISWGKRVILASEITLGLKHLHENNIIHGNLSCLNVLIHDGTAKISGFGLTKILNHENENTEFDIKHTMAGEIPFIDPRRLRDGNYPLDYLSDIYALGVIFWEISSGCPPFRHLVQEGSQLATDIIKGKREVPVYGSPAAYVELYQECWKDEPTGRPNISDVAECLANMSLEPVYDFPTSTRTSLEEIEIPRSRVHSMEIHSQIQSSGVQSMEIISRIQSSSTTQTLGILHEIDLNDYEGSQTPTNINPDLR